VASRIARAARGIERAPEPPFGLRLVKVPAPATERRRCSVCKKLAHVDEIVTVATDRGCERYCIRCIEQGRARFGAFIKEILESWRNA